MITPELINSAIESFGPVPVNEAYQIFINGKSVKSSTGKIVWRTKAGARLGLNQHFYCNYQLLDRIGAAFNMPPPATYDWQYYRKLNKAGVLKQFIDELLDKKIIQIIKVETEIPA